MSQRSYPPGPVSGMFCIEFMTIVRREATQSNVGSTKAGQLRLSLEVYSLTKRDMR